MGTKKLKPVLLFLIIVFLFQCKKEDMSSRITSTSQSQSSNPCNLSVSLSDTPLNLTANTLGNSLADLGKVLFYDRNLSSDNTIRCGSCHIQEKAFCDNKQFSNGIYCQTGSRNAPSIFNKNGKYFWDGRAGNLADMVMMPVQNPIEMNITDLNALCNKLNQISYYKNLFSGTLGTNSITPYGIQNALGAFINTFNFTKNKLMSSSMGNATLTQEELAGKSLFFGSAKCSQCHHVDSMGFGYGNTNESHNIGLDLVSADRGCGKTFNDASRDGEFMIPVIFNVELTAPYMHDGRFKTLDDVLEHYNTKVQRTTNLDWRLLDYSEFPNLNVALATLDTNHNGVLEKNEIGNRGVQNLHLTSTDKQNIIAFLKTLTDPSIKTDSRFSDPFKL